MKLEKYKDKSKSKRKVLLISLGVIVLVSVSLLLYKTFAVFNEHVEFPMMNGKVDYFGNSDVYFVFYKGDELLEEMPQKDNKENLVYERGSCDNGASIEWNESEWAPLVKGLSSPKTKCSLYFKKINLFAKEVVKCGQGGTAAATCITNNASLDENLKNDDYDNLRFTGAEPNNYVSFNNETWRIIGIIDGNLKIMRNTNLDNREWDSNFYNTWSSSTLANYLNNEYAVRNNNMVVSGNYNVGGADSTSHTAKQFYSYEQETKWTGTVGLMTASDYGYAVGGDVIEKCLGTILGSYNSENCTTNDWIYNTISSGKGTWTMTLISSHYNNVFYVHSNGNLEYNVVFNNRFDVFPVVYLNETTRITGGTGEEGSPFILE